MTKSLDNLANLWNKTRNPKYKELWYKQVKEFANGLDNIKRRTISINSCHKANDGTYIFIGTSKLHGPVRHSKVKTNRICRHTKSTHHE